MNWNKLGEVRPNQLITTYGPGAIMDALHDSVTVLDINYWKNTGNTIVDLRLASYLGVYNFKSPQTSDWDDIPIVSFPYYHVCKHCHHLFDIRNGFDRDKYIHDKGPKCPECGWDAYPARFILACEDGHMEDFPWSWWVHNGTGCTGTGRMELISTGNTSSLSEMLVKCSCGAKRTMAGAMQKENFEGLTCSGHHPHRPGARDQRCKKMVIPSQRGASNVYFPVIRSAISIPPWTDPINDIISNNLQTIEAYEADFGDLGLHKAYERYFKDRFSEDEFLKAYTRIKEKIKEFVEIKEMEYAAITHHDDLEFKRDYKYFQAEDVQVKPALKRWFSRLVKIHRLREVMVLLGFMRMEAPEPEVNEPKHICKLNKGSGKDAWLPAVEVHGEGVFIELNRDTVNAWKQNPAVNRLSEKYKQVYAEYCREKEWTMHGERDGEYVLLHTLAHLLIKEMAMQSGYSSTALKERIYSSEKMCGILIYTGSSDKEGSLGGLVELGNWEKFIFILREALQNALTCTTDPECFMNMPQKDRINGAACHSCTMISETACENGNRMLDRALVVPVPEREELGFFRDLIGELCGIQI
ncbi:MAG: DUF1998 domain-containing protein [Acetatifactor sp.]|nr:DUF1998 domain-containing protein [Acetatifactor sp.]